MFKQVKLALLAFSLLCFQASAALITLETKDIQDRNMGSDIKSVWDNNSNRIEAFNLDTFAGIKVSDTVHAYKIAHVNISFDITRQNTLSFDFGLDAGYGAQLYVNNQLTVARNEELWWKNNWNRPDVFSLTNYTFGTGRHNIDLYFAENCCNGTNSIRFTDALNQQTSLLSVSALKAAQVPEPGQLVLFSSALLGLIIRRRSAK